ncbi:hypothetical protein [Bradyrhizobium sp. CCGB20]|uniref:hypothetical protein n=1 Tax=Bradyrhizobium sp. CCGB20 TaxID=2949633 RepID=UPI0020B37459|nr:hypothetical protein [Bradyrhizobium sp. CCGB20]MCP3402989.1 hypothetical protein [Bradyrhizobium sp. CCGB20]
MHVPVPPKSAEPPRGLVEAVNAIAHPDVENAGLTTTTSGEWAAMVRVRRGRPTPIPDVDSQLAGFPVIYETASNEPPVARPAFPDRGE